MKATIYNHFEAFFAVLLIFFAPIAGVIILVALSTIIDTGFGVWRSCKIGEGISSKKFRYGFIPKLLSYVGVVMVVYTSDYFILNELTKMAVSVDFLSTKIISLTLISIEVKSIDESFKQVKGWSFISRFTNIIIKAKNIKKKIDEVD